MLKGSIEFKQRDGGITILAKGYQSHGFLKNKVTMPKKGDEAFVSGSLTTAIPILKSKKDEFYKDLEKNFYTALRTQGYVHSTFTRFKEDCLSVNIPHNKLFIIDSDETTCGVEYKDGFFIHTHDSSRPYYTQFPDNKDYFWVLIHGSSALPRDLVKNTSKETLESLYNPALKIRGVSRSDITTSMEDQKFVPQTGSLICSVYIIAPHKHDPKSYTSRLKYVTLHTRGETLKHYNKADAETLDDFADLYSDAEAYDEF